MGFKLAEAIHPGEVLEDELKFLGVSQKWLADRTGFSEKQISQIVNKQAVITSDFAVLLENVLGTPASTWNNLTSEYFATLVYMKQLEKARNEARKSSKTLNAIYKIMQDYGLTDGTSQKTEKVFRIWKFFGVNAIKQIKVTQPIAYRKLSTKIIDENAMAVWLQCGENEARSHFGKELAKYDENKLKKSLDEILAIAREMPENFWQKTVDILSRSGVILVAVKYFKYTYANGATRWLGQHPVIQVSDRGKTDDILWFTIFHEIAHVLLHSKKMQYISVDNQLMTDIEKEADDFAAEMLIPKKKYEFFIQNNDFSKEAIEKYAHTQKISSSVLLGRLQRDKKVPYGVYTRNNIHQKIKVLPL